MKKMMLLIGLSVGLSLAAQTKKEVTPILEEYFAKMIEKQWANSLDYTYPKLFTIVPRDQMEQQLVSTLNDTSMFVISFNDLELKDVSKVVKEDEYHYSFIDYSMEMTMCIKSGDVEMMASAMTQQFGEENVTLEENTLFIHRDNTLAAIKDKGQKNIYFLEMDERLFPMMATFMSESFMENAKAAK